MNPTTYDVTIIGAGIVGCALARELSKYALSVLVVDRASDLSEGATKANSGIVHAGYDAGVGSNKARFNLRGNLLYRQLHKQLGFHYKPNGSLILCLEGQDEAGLNELHQRGRDNGVQDMRMLGRDKLFSMEPHVSQNAISALYAPTGGIVCPYGAAQAFAENAHANGTRFLFDTAVTGIAHNGSEFMLHTTNGNLFSKRVVNSAGVHAGHISNMADGMEIEIIPRRGEYCILDKSVGNLISHTLFQLPTPMGKGVLVTPTVDGNLMVGPNAIDQSDYDDVSTTTEGIQEVLLKAALSVDHLPLDKIITSFTGLRAHEVSDDFVVCEDELIPGLYHAAGIESPGLTAAPAIAEYLSELLAADLQPALNQNFIAERASKPRFADMDEHQQSAVIKENPLHAHIVCRCEQITEGEIRAAMQIPPAATTTDGIKRRTRCGMGRCQSGFCLPKLLPIMEDELGIPMEQLTKRGKSSDYISSPIKEDGPCIG